MKRAEKEEIANIITHGVGIPISVVALVLLFSKKGNSNGAYLLSVGIFGCTMLWVYTTSTLYHSFYKRAYEKRRFWHMLDHTAIFLFIAGTYTPIAWFHLPNPWNIWILVSVWIIALLGLVTKLFTLGKFKKLSLALYLLMGWLIVFAAKPLWETAPHELVYWVIGGGACYSIGTIFFSLRKMPYAHAIWHLFVLAGSMCHFMGIYNYV